jgi:ubiquinone/menaquinone biosynthesis C-methylase UbiE
MDGHALKFPDASFDAVILHLIVAVIPDPVKCLREAARVLRPGGRAVIFDKFVPDDQRPPLALRLPNPLTSLFGTEITRKLGPLLAESGLQDCASGIGRRWRTPEDRAHTQARRV